MNNAEDKKITILLGKYTEDELNSILTEASKIKDVGRRIAFLSELFLDTPYGEFTLNSDINIIEILVINLEEVDCFTLLDYVEAMRLSGSFSEFRENLKIVRYQSGKIAFESRNHFFTDWVKFNADLVADVTEQIGGENTIKIKKILNLKEDRTYFLDGIPLVQREIKYIPSGAIDDSITNKLKTGDYIGIYSEKQGLDVSHVGIIIKTGDNIYLRHASSIKKKVLDEDFREYMMRKPGFIILRHKD
jgi:hypothetical protein